MPRREPAVLACCSSRSRACARLILAGFLLLPVLAHSQTYTILHDFTGGADGATPIAGVTLGAGGSLNGTTLTGGRRGFGNVYRLVPLAFGWRFDLLYSFRGNVENDGQEPYARVVLGRDGFLYGTTYAGGNGNGCPQRYGCGTVFRISPKPRAILDPWQETILYAFEYHDGSDPGYGDLTFDRQGNLYGTTQNGGAYFSGTIFELTPNASGWTENVLYNFGGSPDGTSPLGSVAIDAAGNLYGTTSGGGIGNAGTVYQLRPSDQGWSEAILYDFENLSGGTNPAGSLALLSSGLFGATQTGGTNNGGAFFDLNPTLGGWNFSVLLDFDGPIPSGSYRTLTVGLDGSFYGTTSNDGPSQQGSVFRLMLADGIWTYTTLHSFTGGADGGLPYGQLTIDTTGTIYGTASVGGAYGNGVVFQITP